MGKSETILSTEEDFNTLIEALDCYCREASTFAYAREAALAAIEASKSIGDAEEIDPIAFEKDIYSKINKERVADSATKIRDKIILLKAKVVSTKEVLKGMKLSREIDSLME